MPEDKDWFAYKFSEAEPRAVVADVAARHGRASPIEAEDVAMTAGAFGALGGDAAGAVRRRRRGHLPVAAVVLLRADDRLIRGDAGARAAGRARLRPRSRGRRGGDHAADPGDHRQQPEQPVRADLPTEPELARLGEVLREASAQHGRPIVLLSDESYNRIVFDGIDFRSRRPSTTTRR